MLHVNRQTLYSTFFSAPKQALLTQHVRVHFCPLPELSDWLLENGQTERETSQRKMDLGEAFKVKSLFIHDLNCREIDGKKTTCGKC